MDNPTKSEDFIKTKKIVMRPKQTFVKTEKYYFMSILTDLTKFLLEAIEYMGSINSQLTQIDDILSQHQDVLSTTCYTDTTNIYSFQKSVNNFTNNLNTDCSKNFYLMTTSNRIHKELNDFKFEPEKTAQNQDIKSTFEKMIAHSTGPAHIKSANNYHNSKIDIANSIINSKNFNFEKFKKYYSLEPNALVDNLYKELVDIQSSLENKKSDISIEINKLIDSLKELFIDTKESPMIVENILDINLVRKRKDAIKNILN